MPIKDSNQNPLEMLAEMSGGGNGRKHPVPQNVMDVEFKVVGDLSLRQLGFLLVGGFGAYVFYNSGLPSFWALAFSGFSILLGVAIAFMPIEERPLDTWLILFVKAMFKETQMIWRKSSVIPAYFLSDYADIIKNEIITLTPIKNRNKLDEYLGLLPEDIDTLDIYQTSKVSKIATVFESQMQNPAKLATESKPISLKETSLQFSPSFSKNQKKEIEEIKKDEIEMKELFIEAHTTNTLPPIQETPKITEHKEIVSTHNITVDRPIKNWPKKYEGQLKGEIKIKTTAKLPPIIVAEDIKEIKQQEVSLEKKIEELMAIASQAKNELSDQGLNLDKSDRIEYFRNKYHELRKEKESLKTELEKNTSRVNEMDEHQKKKDLEVLVAELTKQNEDLEHKLEFIQDQLFVLKNEKQQTENTHTREEKALAEKQATQVEKPIQEIPMDLLQKTAIKYDKPKTEPITNIELPSEMLKQMKKESSLNPQKTSEPIAPEKTQQKENESDNLNFIADKMMKASTNNSFSIGTNQKNQTTDDLLDSNNIIYGTVKDKNGILSENTVVLIKDLKGNVIRALKTNKLGQFKTQTPLPNATYLIEAIKGGENFDIIRIEVAGNKLNPVYLIAKPN